MHRLLARRHEGRRARWSEDAQHALIAGLRRGPWQTAKAIRRWRPQERGIALQLAGVYYGLHRLEASWKVPRKSHKKKDPAREEELKRELVPKREAVAMPAEKRVQGWVEDEHRSGLISVIRRDWTVQGHRPKGPYQTKFEGGDVDGGLDVVTGQAALVYTPTVALPWTDASLKERIATDPEAMHIMIWDRAGVHPNEDSPELPASVRFLPLPAYSPEVNPIESLWDPVQRRIATDVWETLENIEAAISEVLEPFWHQVEQVQSLLGDSWLTPGVATFLDRRQRLIST